MEIKFRAWNGEYMSDVRSIDFQARTWERYGDVHGLKSGMANVVFMQFTGLLDKNGKEIYTGDRVKCQHWVDNKLQWLKGMVSYDENCCRYMIGHTAISGTVDAGREIIGTKFDTPDQSKKEE